MSTRKISTYVSLVSTLLILGYYLLNLVRMIRQGALNSDEVFRLAAVVVIASIVLNIAGNIITMIVIHIIHAIQTRSDRELRLIDDERDNLIGLKGTQVSYFALSLGLLIAMLTFVFGQPALSMFSLMIFFALLAEICGDLAQLFFYSRGS